MAAGVNITERPSIRGTDDKIDVHVDGLATTFVIATRNRAPSPSQVPDLVANLANAGGDVRPLLIMPFVTQGLASAFAAAEVSWADHCRNFDLRAPGLRLRQRTLDRPTMKAPRTLPQGSGALAIIRALINGNAEEMAERGATALASYAGVSQPRASQVLRQLGELGLIMKLNRTSWRAKREPLLDRFLDEYRGPGGTQHFFYSLEEPSVTAIDMVERYCGGDSDIDSDGAISSIAVSADTGPDLVASWRRPSHLVVYTRVPIDPKACRLVEAKGSHDANVIVREPTDRSLWPTSPLIAKAGHTSVPLADPTQLLWDLYDLGGSDRAEAAEKVREWILCKL